MKYQLAQINIARALAPMESPTMQGFVDQLDPINDLADHSAGFVWRLQTEEGDATSLQVFDDPLVIVNMSVWDSFESLKNFVYSSEHLSLVQAKKAWFGKLSSLNLALWWVPEGHLPSVDEGKAALQRLGDQGPSEYAFSFAQPFPAVSAEQSDQRNSA